MSTRAARCELDILYDHLRYGQMTSKPDKAGNIYSMYVLRECALDASGIDKLIIIITYTIYYKAAGAAVVLVARTAATWQAI